MAFNPGTNSNVSGSLWNMMSQQTGEDAAMRRQQSGQQFTNMLDLRRAAEQHEEGEKKILQAGKVAQQIFKMNPDMQKAIGMSPEAFAAKAAQDQDAIVTGFFKNIGVQEYQHKQALEADVQDQNAKRNNAMAYLSTLDGPIGLRELAAAAQGTGVRWSPQELVASIREQDDGRAGGAVDWESNRPRFGETPQGQPFIYGRSGQYQILPDFDAGIRYDLSPGGAELATDSRGRTIPLPDTSRRAVNAYEAGLKHEELVSELEKELRRTTQVMDFKSGVWTNKPKLTPEEAAKAERLRRRLDYQQRLYDQHITDPAGPAAPAPEAGRRQYPQPIGPALPVPARPVASPPLVPPSAGPAVSLPPEAFARQFALGEPALPFQPAAALAPPPAARPGFNPAGIARPPGLRGLEAITPQLLRAPPNDAQRAGTPAPETNGLPVTTSVPAIDWRGELDRANNQAVITRADAAVSAAAQAAKAAGWQRVRMPDGRLIWGPPERVKELLKRVGYDLAPEEN
jgi:hypothetical protein